MPDGYKDMPADRLGPRLRLKESLDAIYSEKLPNDRVLDSVSQALWYRLRSLCSRFPRILSGLCDPKAIGLCYDMELLPPHRKHSGQDFFDSSVCALPDYPLEQGIALGLRSHSRLE